MAGLGWPLKERIAIPRNYMSALYEAVAKCPEMKDGEEKTVELLPKEESATSSSDPAPGSPEWFAKLTPKKD